MININIDKKLSDKVNVHIASIEAKVKTKESDKELLELINKKCEEIKENINSQIPLRRMGSAKEVAELVYFLGEDASSYITGQVINVDGGMI